MALSPFQLINPNMPAASAGQLPDLLGLFGTPPLLNSFTPVQTPLQQMLGQPEPIGSETRPYPLGAFPDNDGDQYTSSSQASSTEQKAEADSSYDSTDLSGSQAGSNSLDSTGVTPNAAGVDPPDSSSADSSISDSSGADSAGSSDGSSGGSSDGGDGNFYSVMPHFLRLNLIA